MKAEELINAAEELNEVLGLDPAIDTSQDLEKLKEEVSEAAELVEPEDDLSAETIEVIDNLLNKDGEIEDEKEVEVMDDKEESEEESDEEGKLTGGEVLQKPAEKEKPKPATPKVSGRTMTVVMDEALSAGGDWKTITDKVRKEAESLGYDSGKYTTGAIRAHAKHRISKGTLDIKLTDNGVGKG